MDIILKHCFWILFIFFNVPISETSDNETWGEDCPLDCECRITDTSQTHFTKWKFKKSSVKTALCLVTNETLESIIHLPNDIESVTFLQTNDDTSLFFTRDIFEGLVEVKSMEIQGSLQDTKTHITNDLLHNMRYLKFLSLQRVDLNGAEKAFSKLSSLEILYVIHSNVGYLKWEMLDGLQNLKELWLVQSGIKELYGFAFYGTPELRRLFLSHNDLFSVEADAFVGLLKLELLDLSNNHIDHLSGLTFPPLPHLQWLELKHNPIKVIFPHCFQYLNGTQHLTLGHKQQPVHLMKFSFRGLYSLIYLHIPNIDNDALFEHMFYDLKSLLHLNLQGRIKIINSRAFNGAHRYLKKLILHNCQLERLYKDSFHGLENLHILDLSVNLLHSLPNDVFRDLKSVLQIKLNSNLLKQISNNIFYPAQNMKSLLLFDNPWNCSCEMKHWKEVIVTAKYEPTMQTCNETECFEKNVIYYENDFIPKCEYPDIYKGKNVFYVLKAMSC